MKKAMLVCIFISFVMLSGCTDNDKDGENNFDNRKSVEFDASDFSADSESYDDIVFDFKNPDNKDNVVITPKQ